MASIGSLSLIPETKRTDSYVILNTKSHHRPRFPFFSNLPRKCLDSTRFSSSSARGSSSVVGLGSGLIGGCRRGKLQRNKLTLRAIDKDSEAGEEGPDDALQATIEKSKKVLALQRDLLQQVLWPPIVNSFVVKVVALMNILLFVLRLTPLSYVCIVFFRFICKIEEEMFLCTTSKVKYHCKRQVENQLVSGHFPIIEM